MLKHKKTSIESTNKKYDIVFFKYWIKFVLGKIMNIGENFLKSPKTIKNGQNYKKYTHIIKKEQKL